MNRHFLFLLGLMLCVPALWAGPIDKEQAMQKAQRFYSDRGQTSKVRKLKQAPRAAEVSTAMENDCFYVFNAGEDDGYVIISGDDRTPDVLGYCDSGTFRADDMPENIKAWLDEYASQIRYLQDIQTREANLTGASRAAAGAQARIATHPAVAPLLATKWNQDAPYNNQCPVFFDESKYGRAVTGCVALAMAQIMKFWNYPKTTLKYIPNYPCTTDWSSYIGSSSTMRIDVPEVGITTFDWDNMLNTYDNSASDTQKKAVATLLQACATSAKAEFGINEVGGTSADPQILKGALVRYFDYDKGMRYVSRCSYTADQWDELIYSEMKAHRPVFFSGNSTTSGHTFVVDGYDGNGYYHVNWGWGGLNNGYFLLSVLNPEDESGIGAGKGGYNLNVEAIIGVKPNAGNDNPLTDIMTVKGGMFWKNSYTRSSTSDNFTGISVAYNFYNKTGITTTFDMGYGIYDSNRTLKEVIKVMENVDLLANQGVSTDETKATFNFGAGISSGEYCIVPISKLSASTQWQPCAGAWSSYVVATISGNTLSLAFITKKIDVDLELVNTPEAKGPVDMKITFTNNGPYYNGGFLLYENKKRENLLYVDHLELQKGETKTLNASIILDEQRTYVICCSNSDEDDGAAISITPTAPKEQKLTCTYNVTNANASREINADQMEMTIEYQNIGSNDYDNEILLKLMKRVGTTNSYNMVATMTDRLKLSKGAKTKCSYVFRDLEDGGTYMVVPMYKSKGEYVEMTKSNSYTVHFTSTPPEIGEAYAVVNGSTLTFYYDDKKGDRQGKKYEMNTEHNYPGWAVDSLGITKAVIDASFAAYSPTTTAHWFEHETSLTSIEGLTNLNTSATTIMQSMFYECYALTSLDVSKFDTQNVTDMRWMFFGCNSLKSLNVKNFNTSKVTSMKSMFNRCLSLTSLDLSTFDTRNVTDMGWLFYKCSALTSLNVKNFNTSKVTDIQSMFDSCYSLTSIDISNFDTRNVTNMGWLFYGCKALTNINFGNMFNTSKATNMKSMFCGCSSLKNLDLSFFDTRNVTDMGWMFYQCSLLESVNVSGFNTAKVTMMNNMFQMCPKLKSLDLKSFSTSKVTDMAQMFSDDYALAQLNVSSFNTANVTTMYCMFYDCESLNTLDVSSFRTPKVEDMRFMFRGCKSLKMLDLSGFSIESLKQFRVMFHACWELTTIYASSSWNNANIDDSGYMFGECSKLVGGAGTKFDSNHIDKQYARIDGGTASPGYFTYKAAGKKGDVNGDGTIDVADIATIIDAMAGTTGNSRADVNGDGTIDVADIGAVIDIMAGKGDDTPAAPAGAVAVNLGLPSGTLWANMNVGAQKAEDYGDYFAWGETKPKGVYSWATYTHCNGSEGTCHNIGSDIAGTAYDAARANWGGQWQMPTHDQIRELADNCSYVWTEQNGVYGCKFTGPNGNSIFLPAAGRRSDSDLVRAGKNGYYWASTLDENASDYAPFLQIGSNSVLPNNLFDRYFGFSVRPVRRN